MLSARDAETLIWDSVEPIGASAVPVEGSQGSVLAEDVVAGEHVPPFDNAAMDGYAVRSGDVSTVPAALAVTGETIAGTAAALPLAPASAVRIMTGGVIPAGCDAVVQQEWTEPDPPGRVRVLRTTPAGHNIRKTGSDITAGTTVLRRGMTLRPQEIGLLASLGRTSVLVSRRPVVALLATGNELVDGDAPLGPGKIRNSNAPMLSALLREEGCDVQSLGIARDEAGDLRAKIGEGLGADMLVSSGGVSVGTHDLVSGVLEELGVEIRFWKVNIKPGMPLLFGMRGRTPVFGLPGNPVSTMVTFLKFVRPALRRMKGCSWAGGGIRLTAALEEPMTKQDARRHFVRGILSERDGRPSVRPTGSQVSNVLSSLVLANCLITLPEDIGSYAAGDQVEVELL